MEKKDFTTIMNQIIGQTKADDDFSKGFKIAFPESITPVPNNGYLWDAIINLFKSTIDPEGWIEWWIFEDNMKGEHKIIWNNKEVYIKNVDELWEFLREYYNI